MLRRLTNCRIIIIVTGIESKDRVAGLHVEARAWIRPPDTRARYLARRWWWWRWSRRIALTIVGAKLRVREVTTFVVVVTYAEFLQLGEVNMKCTAAVVHVLTVQRLTYSTYKRKR